LNNAPVTRSSLPLAISDQKRRISSTLSVSKSNVLSCKLSLVSSLDYLYSMIDCPRSFLSWPHCPLHTRNLIINSPLASTDAPDPF
jgi:hypothetical protein